MGRDGLDTPLFLREGGRYMMATPERIKTLVTKRYMKLYAGKFVLSGQFPDDMPNNFFGNMIFKTGCFGLIKTTTWGLVGVGGAPAGKVGFYGDATMWKPFFGGTQPMTGELNKERDGLKEPLLQMGEIISMELEEYIDQYAFTLMKLKQCVNLLAGPVFIKSAQGIEGDAKDDTKDAENGKLWILKTSDTNSDAKFVQGMDYTQGIINTLKHLDNEIKNILGFKNSGMGKASGVNPKESSSQDQSLLSLSNAEMKIIGDWCDLVKKRMGLDISVGLDEDYIKSFSTASETEVPTIEQNEGDDNGNE